MNWSPNVWAQIKNLTCDELISALERDGWVRDLTHGAVLVFLNPAKRRRITIHYHPRKTFNSPKLLKTLIEQAGWDEADLRRLRLIR